MINIFIFLSLGFLITFVVGALLEKIRIPWIFAAIIVGVLLNAHNPFTYITSSNTFNFLAQLGMYFLLFMIGFEIDLKEMKKQTRFILEGTLFIISLETSFGSLLIHYLFGCDWFISALVALSFATVGEAVLIPILDEFRMVNTRLGQTIIGVGTLDDLIEIFSLILVVILVGSRVQANINIVLILTSLFTLFFLTIGLTEFRGEGRKFNVLDIETLFLFTIFILFLFLGVGEYAESAPLAAMLAGISLKTFLPKKRLKLIESEVKTMCYGFFAPVFFLWVGVSMDKEYLLHYPHYILLVVIISSALKLLGSYIIGRNELGLEKSILLGIGLSVRFSTSIIVLKILYDSALIDIDLYSVIIASSIVLTFIIPLLFSNLAVRLGDNEDMMLDGIVTE